MVRHLAFRGRRLATQQPFHMSSSAPNSQRSYLDGIEFLQDALISQEGVRINARWQRTFRRTLSTHSFQVPTSAKVIHVVDLEANTLKWLEETTWSWDRLNQGRFLIKTWLDGALEVGLPWATRIFSRLVHSSQTAHRTSQMESAMVEVLNQLLRGWKKHPKCGGQDAATVSIRLLNEMLDASFRPGHVAYSLAIYALSAHPSEPDTCDKAEALLERLTLSESASLVAWNSCLHVFAKCSPYHPDAAQRAESLLQRMPVPPDGISFASVLNAWSKSSHPTAAARAEAILKHMLASDNVDTNITSLNTCIDAWAKSGRSDAAQRAQRLLKKAQELYQQGHDKLQPNSATYGCVINAWAQCDDVNAAQNALQLLDQMQALRDSGNSKVRPNIAIITSVICALARSGKKGAAQQAEDLLQRAEQLHVNGDKLMYPTLFTYTSVIHAWANSKEPNAAQRADAVLNRMEFLTSTGQPNLAPDTVTYSAIINAWSKSGDRNAPQRALALLRKMQDLQRRGNSYASPNTVTFNAVIAACANWGCAALATSLLKEMQDMCARGQVDVEPNTITYSSVINAYAKSNDEHAGERAQRLLDEMELLHKSGNFQVRPNTVTYTSAIAAWKQSRRSDAAHEAEGILWRMQKLYESGVKEVRPNMITVMTVMGIWSHGREAEALERVEALFKWMISEYKSGNEEMKPDRVSYRFLICLLARCRRPNSIPRIKAYLEEMEQNPDRSVHPDANSYNQLMIAIRDSNHGDKAIQCYRVLQQMIRAFKEGNKEIKPNVYSFLIVLGACEETSGQQERHREVLGVVREVFLELSSYKSLWVPNEFTNEKLIAVCKRLGDSDLTNDVVRHYGLPAPTRPKPDTMNMRDFPRTN